MGHYCKVIKRILKKIFQYFFPAISKEKKFKTSRFVLLVLWLLKIKEYTGEVSAVVEDKTASVPIPYLNKTETLFFLALINQTRYRKTDSGFKMSYF